MIKLLPVYAETGEPFDEAVSFLYRLLKERPLEANVSHSHMPTLEEHRKFVRTRPYRAWYLVAGTTSTPVGAVYATEYNELGIAILREHQRKGYAESALRAIMRELSPLPAIPTKRRGTFVANVAPRNEKSKALFEKLGGRVVQVTYELPSVPSTRDAGTA